MPTETLLTAEKLLSDYYEFKKSRSHPARSVATRASSLGHPCTAYLAWQRVAGEKEELPDARLACIFAEGELQEHGVLSDLREMGYRVFEHQRSVYWDKFELSGHIDGWIVTPSGEKVLIDVKSCSPFAFVKFNTQDDIRNASQWFYVKWLAQLQVYMLMESVDRSWIILKNKTYGEIKVIELTLDYAYAEGLLKKAEEVKEGVHDYQARGESDWRNTWLKSSRLNDAEICSECHFKSICLPEIDAGSGVQSFDDPEMADKLSRREELQAAAKEFEELDKEIKEDAKRQFQTGNTHLICGNYSIIGKESTRKGFTVKESKIWKTVIERI